MEINKCRRVVLRAIDAKNQHGENQAIVHQPAEPDILPRQRSLEVHFLLFHVIHRHQKNKAAQQDEEIFLRQNYGVDAKKRIRVKEFKKTNVGNTVPEHPQGSREAVGPEKKP